MDYKELIVWNKSMELVELVYKLTKTFPKDEYFGLRSQIRRSALSIPSNIAEGNCRRTKGEYIQFLSIANGSKGELETQVILAHRLGFINSNNFKLLINQIIEISKMLYALMKSLR